MTNTGTRRALLVTGANGHLGRCLIAELPADCAVEALVRSERARRVLLRHVGARPGLRITVVDPADADTLAVAAARCDRAVHLIGTIRETRDNRYRDSHQRPAHALIEAAARCALKHIVYISILGADAASPSRCLRARAAVENALRAATTPSTVIRVPMVLGEADRASAALARRAAMARVFLFRAASLEQPIYAGDVIAAAINALGAAAPHDQVFDLAGPESLPRHELVARAAALVGRQPTIHSLPLWVGLVLAGALEICRANPPLTRDMLRVLDHDDAIDAHASAAALGINLTPLDEMLRRCIANRRSQDAIA